jgi:DNA-binding LytR/AlgR family response regulator
MTGDGRLALLAVDDERPALEDLVRMLEGSPAVAEVQDAASAAEALLALGDGERFDGVFLDVRMPGLDGVRLARLLRRFARPPAVVFVTAFDDAAISAFELGALDYLVKPVSVGRIRDAIERMRRSAAGRQPSAGDADADGLDVDFVSVACLRGGTRLIPRSSVIVLQARGDYVRVRSDHGRFILHARIGELGERWARHGFARVHRGFVVNLRRAVELRPRAHGTAILVMADGLEVPVARRQVGQLWRRLRA